MIGTRRRRLSAASAAAGAVSLSGVHHDDCARAKRPKIGRLLPRRRRRRYECTTAARGGYGPRLCDRYIRHRVYAPFASHAAAAAAPVQSAATTYTLSRSVVVVVVAGQPPRASRNTRYPPPHGRGVFPSNDPRGLRTLGRKNPLLSVV